MAKVKINADLQDAKDLAVMVGKLFPDAEVKVIRDEDEYNLTNEQIDKIAEHFVQLHDALVATSTDDTDARYDAFDACFDQVNVIIRAALDVDETVCYGFNEGEVEDEYLFAKVGSNGNKCDALKMDATAGKLLKQAFDKYDVWYDKESDDRAIMVDICELDKFRK